MLVTIDPSLEDGRRTTLTRDMFDRMWRGCNVECRICFDIINGDGVVAVTEYRRLNVEKMFHTSCLRRWQRERTRDPFNRNVRYWFNFPPKTLDECESMMRNVDGFMGDEEADRLYAEEYGRLNKRDGPVDVEIDFSSLLRRNAAATTRSIVGQGPSSPAI